ncbi:MAG: long-chain fatty acid--CoA ligase [Hyphomicrobiales bacterium]|nr:long-chain fatty acid--CoA ligase [Hyphomicrobiales bacterium]
MNRKAGEREQEAMDNSDTPRIIPDFVDVGFAKNSTGVACSTKRKGAWTETSVDDFRARIDQLALGFYDLGLRHGDRVALHAENSTEWLIVEQAALRVGAVVVPIYPTQPPDQVRFILENSGARIYVVSSEALYDTVKPHVGGIATLESTVGILGAFDDNMHGFEQILERGGRRHKQSPELLAELRAAISPDDLATLAYTSGTTGEPKGCMLTHGNIVFDALAVLHVLPFEPEAHRGGSVLSYLPLSHAYERIIALIVLHIGYPMYFIQDVNEIREAFLTVKPIHFTSVPRLLEKVHSGVRARGEMLTGMQKRIMHWALDLAERYDVEKPIGAVDRLQLAVADRLVYRKIRTLLGGNLVSIISGGAALPPATMSFFNALGIFCAQGYGMTETAPVIAACRPGATRAGSVGRPLPGVDVKIDKDGEILTRGPHVMNGYYKLPDQTAQVMTDGGWLHTGDIGRIDDDGYVFITDRKKELFKLSTGKYIAPTVVELALSSSTFIEQVVVVGSDRQFCGALIVPDVQAIRGHFRNSSDEIDGSELSASAAVAALIQQEINAINPSLAQWERVKRFRLLEQPFTIESGELTSTMKVKRRIVHAKYSGEIAKMYG